MTAPRRDQDSVCQCRQDGGESGIARLIPEPRPSLALGASLRLSKFVPDKFVEPVGSSTPLLPQKRKTPHEGALSFLAERVGFEPTVRQAVRRISSPVL